MIKEVMHTLPVLCVLILANIALGTLNSLAVEKIQFDKKRMINGVLKAVAAVAAVFSLAYAFDTIDLTSLGFSPMTIVSTGIIVYAVKVGINLVKILGLDAYIKIISPLDKSSNTESSEEVK